MLLPLSSRKDTKLLLLKLGLILLQGGQLQLVILGLNGNETSTKTPAKKRGLPERGTDMESVWKSHLPYFRGLVWLLSEGKEVSAFPVKDSAA